MTTIHTMKLTSLFARPTICNCYTIRLFSLLPTMDNMHMRLHLVWALHLPHKSLIPYAWEVHRLTPESFIVASRNRLIRYDRVPVFAVRIHTLTILSIQLSGPPVDVLATSRTRRSSVRLPSPSDLLAAQRSSPRAESVISGTSSLCTNTSSHASTGYTSKVDKHGIVRNVRRVHRRTLAELPAASTTSAKSIPVSEVTNISKASSIFISDLFNKHAWPLTSMKHPMIVKAFQQSNAMAKREGHDTTEILKDHEAKVYFHLI